MLFDGDVIIYIYEVWAMISPRYVTAKSTSDSLNIIIFCYKRQDLEITYQASTYKKIRKFEQVFHEEKGL